MKNLFKKFSVIALLLVAAIVTVGCGDKKTKYTVTYYDVDDVNTPVGTETVVEGNVPTGLISNYVLESEMFKDAAMTEAWGDAAVTANVSIYGEFTSKDGYTYQSSFSLSPSTFNPFQYKSTTDSVPLDYTTLGLYGFTYNATETGFELKPVMAAADPVDVTAEYAKDNSWGIEGETSGYAFRIALNRHATWENGEVINADDYIYSLKALLDPEFQNYRASDYYAGSNAIFGAKDYFYSGQTTYLSAVEVVGDTQEGYEGLYFDASNVTAFANLMGGTDLTKLANYKGYFSDGETNYYDQLVTMAGDKRVPMTEELTSLYASINCFKTGTLLFPTYKSSPNSKANGSSPTKERDCKTACPSPSCSFCLTK